MLVIPSLLNQMLSRADTLSVEDSQHLRLACRFKCLTLSVLHRHGSGLSSGMWQDGFVLRSLSRGIKYTPGRLGGGSTRLLGRGGINQGTLPEFESFL